MTDLGNPWRPLNTAPRDGEIIDLWFKGGGRIVDVWWVSEDECWSCMMDDSDFTHWMPIPEGPIA